MALLLSVQVSPLQAQSFPELRWQKFLGFNGDDRATCVRRSSDKHLFVGGNIQEEEGRGPCSDLWVVKMDTNGKVLWERSFGGSGCDELRDMAATPDSGVIFVGITSSFIEHPEKGEEMFQGDFFIGKLNHDGTIGWLKTYGGIDLDQAYGIAKQGNEYVVAGASSSQNFDVVTELGMTNLWCVKVMPDGTKRTSWAYGGSKHDWGFSITACKNGDYVIVGYTASEDIDGTERRTNGDGWILRIDRYGAMKWQKIFSGKFEDYFTDVAEDRDGRLVLCGVFESEEKSKQFWFLKLTSEGAKIYEKIFGDVQDEYTTSVTVAADGGYLLTGYSRYTSLVNEQIKGGEDFWVMRLDGRANVVWSTTYGGRDDERAHDIIEYRPGVYYAVGEKLNNFEAGGTLSRKKDFWILRIEEMQCEEIDIKVFTSLQDNTAYVNKSFKLKPVVEKGDSFLWDFGDGNHSRDREPVHTYTAPGVYEVKLTVFINNNCSKTYKLPNYIMVW